MLCKLLAKENKMGKLLFYILLELNIKIYITP